MFNRELIFLRLLVSTVPGQKSTGAAIERKMKIFHGEFFFSFFSLCLFVYLFVVFWRGWIGYGEEWGSAKDLCTIQIFHVYVNSVLKCIKAA
jgi:hypothetical protein